MTQALILFHCLIRITLRMTSTPITPYFLDSAAGAVLTPRMLHRTDLDSAGDSLAICNAIVLIVEDDGVVAMMIEELARDLGAGQVLVCRRPDDALRAALHDPITYAILDVAVWGASSYEVADSLARRNIPFLFSTGMRREDIDARHRQRPLLEKPFTEQQFRLAVQALS